MACAAIGENCELGYIRENGLDGCCPGLLCDIGAAGIRVCRVGTAEEEVYARECQRAAYSADTTMRVEQGVVATNYGTFDLSEVSRADPYVGPEGCVTGIQVVVTEGSSDCFLLIGIGAVGGELGIAFVEASFGGCEAYTGPEPAMPARESDPVMIPFAAVIDLVSCDWGGGFEGFCTSGRMDLSVQGSIADVEFQATQLTLTGACVARPEGECLP
jgi:hypothetical protein